MLYNCGLFMSDTAYGCVTAGDAYVGRAHTIATKWAPSRLLCLWALEDVKELSSELLSSACVAARMPDILLRLRLLRKYAASQV